MISERQLKAPKIYIRDSGILHQLLGISSLDNLLSHPKAVPLGKVLLAQKWFAFARLMLIFGQPIVALKLICWLCNTVSVGDLSLNFAMHPL
jgi:hypothetical protein